MYEIFFGVYLFTKCNENNILKILNRSKPNSNKNQCIKDDKADKGIAFSLEIKDTNRQER